jgi:P-type E1-E2 ATPase
LVEGRSVIVGGIGFVESRLQGRHTNELRQLKAAGRVVVAVAVDGRMEGAIVLADDLRAGTSHLLSRLKALGIERIVLATGDRSEVAFAVAAGLPIDSVRAELSPDQKVMLVLAEHKHGPVMMVGDGVNDAPALAAADLGIAMGARGAAAAAEVADVVFLVDSLERLVPAVEIARRSKAVALESVYAGIGLSVIGMIAAAFGHITPVQGALLQEVIDVAVILNALTALKG